MVARIYKPAKTAMQSGRAKTKNWVLDFEPASPREIEPLMGWTSFGTTLVGWAPSRSRPILCCEAPWRARSIDAAET